MSFFLSGFFWFIEGIFVCLSVIGFSVWAKERGVKMSFFKWTVLALWFVLFGFSLAFTGTCIGENEITAAIRGGILFGVLSIVSGVLVWLYVMGSFGRKV